MPTPRPYAAELPLAAYRAAVALDEPFRPTAAPAPADRLADHVRAALGLLSSDVTPHLRDADHATARQVLRALLTVRAPGPLPGGATAELDSLLGGERIARATVDGRQLPTIKAMLPDTLYPVADRTVLWQGDITTLAADAIVNAANSALMGCFVPRHPCIDNAIHDAAGPRLRDDCHLIMSRQNAPEHTGTAKITRGYHLPARYVLHTVGPFVEGVVHPSHEHALASAYRSCLDLAAEVDTIRTLAFCAVSTGLFGFPKASAARIALRTVAEWMSAHPGRLDRVIFTVFSEDDQDIYRTVLGGCGIRR
ncbi:protein-ADP-ribose hydrolase [Streptomyces sp. NPDC021098]|uniref:protein-ADP-ribose hydrolase n=1 Tax=unclassified Streptomyces TaxID=2593676 RepID=UPI0037A41599